MLKQLIVIYNIAKFLDEKYNNPHYNTNQD